ncbi:aromatic acid exporter family protein, partial [Neobacillus niacini]
EKSFKEQMEKLENDIFQLEEQFILFDEEREKMSKINHMDVREIVVFKQMFKSLQHGYMVLEDIDSIYFTSKPTLEENQLFDQHLEYLIKYHELFLLKYDGKIKMDLPSLEDEFMKQTEVFLEKVMQSYQEKHKIQMAVIGASIYHYALQLDRLNTLVEQYRKKSQ